MKEPSAPAALVEPKILDDIAVDGAPLKELRAAYKELRAFCISRTEQLAKLRQKIRAKTKSALREMKKCDMKTGGDEPYGYQLGPDGKKLRPYRPEQELIKTIVDLRSRGATFHSIAVRLNARGKRNRNNGLFHTKTIIRIVRAAELREAAARAIAAKQAPSPHDP